MLLDIHNKKPVKNILDEMHNNKVTGFLILFIFECVLLKFLCILFNL